MEIFGSNYPTHRPEAGESVSQDIPMLVGGPQGVRLKFSELKQKVVVSGNDDCMNCMRVGQPKNKET